MSDYPNIFRLRQLFDAPEVSDIAGEVENQLSRLQLAGKIQPGQTVAISAGSRGIANIHIIINYQEIRQIGSESIGQEGIGIDGG